MMKDKHQINLRKLEEVNKIAKDGGTKYGKMAFMSLLGVSRKNDFLNFERRTNIVKYLYEPTQSYFYQMIEHDEQNKNIIIINIKDDAKFCPCQSKNRTPNQIVSLLFYLTL